MVFTLVVFLVLIIPCSSVDSVAINHAWQFPLPPLFGYGASMAPFPVLFLLFLAVPLAEIYFLIVVGGWIGALPTVLLVILTAAIGAALARHQGYAALQRLQRTLARGEVPAVEMLEGVILLIGALLLLTPGFLTDLAGFICLIPVSRRALASWAWQRISVTTPPPSGSTGPSSGGGPRTLEGEFHREDD